MRILALLLAASGVASATDVLTHHNNLARTGAVLDEKLLSPATLKDQAFGRLFSVVVDGQIYAQPLVVTGLAIPGKGTRNVVFVATMRNMVYAFDADNAEPEPLWRVSLGAPMPYDRIPKDGGALLGQYNVRPYIGVTSTPVIDRERQLIYVVAKIAEPQCPGAEAGHRRLPRGVSHTLARSVHRRNRPSIRHTDSHDGARRSHRRRGATALTARRPPAREQ